MAFGGRLDGGSRAPTIVLAALLAAGAAAAVEAQPAGSTSGTPRPAAGANPTQPAGTTAGTPRPAAGAERGNELQVENHSPREGHPSLGPAGAPNTLIVFIDYQCPVCPRAARELKRLVADFGGDVRVEIRHHPLAMHRNAFDAAAAAKAAQRQGRFWDYHESLLKESRFDRGALIALAAALGLDSDRFARDLDDTGLRRQVAAESQQAQDAGAQGTPAFLIDGHVEVGWASLPWLEQKVRAHSR